MPKYQITRLTMDSNGNETQETIEVELTEGEYALRQSDWNWLYRRLLLGAGKPQPEEPKDQ